MEIIYILLAFILILFLYFLPAFLAFSRNHRNRWVILIVNIVFGVTILGWLIALVWAMNKVDDPKKGGTKYGPSPNDSSL